MDAETVVLDGVVIAVTAGTCTTVFGSRNIDVFSLLTNASFMT